MKKSEIQVIWNRYKDIEARGYLPAYRDVWPCFQALIELDAIANQPWALEALTKFEKAMDLAMKWDGDRDQLIRDLKKHPN
jgi:hypothetical protein